METLVIVFQVIACVLIVVSVLLQPAKGGQGVLIGGSSQSVFGSTGGTTFLFRITMWAAGFLMLSSLFVSWYKVHQSKRSVIDLTTTSPSAPVTAPISAPAAPTAPAKPTK